MKHRFNFAVYLYLDDPLLIKPESVKKIYYYVEYLITGESEFIFCDILDMLRLDTTDKKIIIFDIKKDTYL